MKQFDPAFSVIEWLERHGHQARIAGGAVRDHVLGVEPKDVDVATTARPDDVLNIFPHTIPTGLQHGTVTVMVHNTPIEVTTLRRDVATDGRHAEVEFIDDWEEDARRRDFTFNAMFMDRSGQIFDFFDGQKDLKNGRVRFVGSADDRIKEDYLRIMRFFRFMSRLENPKMTDEDREVIKANVDGLKQISGERIWSELLKIFASDKIDIILHDMRSAGVLKEWLRPLAPIKGIMKETKDPLTRFWMVAGAQEFHRKSVVERFKISREELQHAELIDFVVRNAWDIFLLVEQSNGERNKWNQITEILAVCAAVNHMFFDSWRWFHETDPVHIPVRGQDLISEGMVPGPELGLELKKRRRKWFEEFMQEEKR